MARAVAHIFDLDGERQDVALLRVGHDLGYGPCQLAIDRFFALERPELVAFFFAVIQRIDDCRVAERIIILGPESQVNHLAGRGFPILERADQPGLGIGVGDNLDIIAGALLGVFPPSGFPTKSEDL